MAGPITWRNINGPALSDGVAAPLAAAQRSFDTAFSRAGDELARRENTNTQNYETGKVNNTEDFLAQLAQFRTPEELQAAQASGVLDTLRQGYGAQVDQAAVRQAQDLRPSLLQERALKNNQYQDAQVALTERPIVEAIQAATAAGDSNTFNRLIEQNPTLRNRAALLQGWDSRNAAAIKAGREDTNFQQAQAMLPLERQRIEAQIAASLQSTATNKTQAEVAAASLVDRRIAAEAKAKADALELSTKSRQAAEARIVKGTALETGDMRSGTAVSKVQEVMGKLKDATPQNINEMYTAIEKVAPGGMITIKRGGKSVELPVPVDVVIKAIQGAYDSWSPFSDHGDAVRDYITKAMSSPALQDEIIGVESRRALLDSAASPVQAPAQLTSQEIEFRANGGKPLPK